MWFYGQIPYQLNHVDVARFLGCPKHVSIARKGVCASAKQNLHGLPVAIHYRYPKSRVIVRIDTSTCFKQHPDGIRMAKRCRNLERPISLCVHVGSCGEQFLHSVGISALSRSNQFLIHWTKHGPSPLF
jgi:hypothetical protein